MAALALIAALYACTANGGSIYATIETEKKINVSTLDQYLTIIDLANVPAAPLPYFVAAGAVYNGTVADASNNIGWPTFGGTPGVVAPPVSGALCAALTYFNATLPANTGLYGGFFTSDGSVVGLYRSAAASPSFSTAIAAMAGKQIALLAADPNDPAKYLFASVANLGSGTTGFTYELDYSADGFASTTSVALTGQPKITGVAYFPVNSTYYVTSGSVLYAGLTPGSLSPTSIPNNGEQLQGATVDPVSNYILIPSNNGAVYYSQNGTAWARASTSDQINGYTVSLLNVSAQVGNNGPGPVYLVGADGLGFYTLNVQNNTLSRFSDVTVTGLYAGAVRRILVDPIHNNLVFMGTAGTGLWRANFDPATGLVAPGSSWIHE